ITMAVFTGDDRAATILWQPVWRERELVSDTDLIGPIMTAPTGNPSGIDLYKATGGRAQTERFLLTLGMLLDAAGTPLEARDEIEGNRRARGQRSGSTPAEIEGWVTRHVRLRGSSG